MATTEVGASKGEKGEMSANQEKTIDICFGIFFDGTENNKIQALIGEIQRNTIGEKNIQEGNNGNVSLKELMEKQYDEIIKNAEEEKKIYETVSDNFISENDHLSNIIQGFDNLIEKTKIKKEELSTLDHMKLLKKYYKDKDAQKNDRSNIALLEPHYKGNDNAENKYRIYVEGCGTEDTPEKASSAGFGTGFGAASTGIISKVASAINHVNRQIKMHPKSNLQLEFDVFGFSRGAATARNFVWQILKNNVLEYEKIINVTVNFVGLYDTVSSYGAHMALFKDTSDVKTLHLDAITNVKKVFQICATDEFRLNFNLTNIKSAINAGKGIEIFIPGAHSDIGGGYAKGKHTVKLEKGFKYKIFYTNMINNKLQCGVGTDYLTPNGKIDFATLSIENYMKLGWIAKNAEKVKKYSQLEKHPSTYFEDAAYIGFSNDVKKGYSYIGLNLMREDKDVVERFNEINSKFEVPEGILKETKKIIEQNIGKEKYIYKLIEKETGLYEELRSNYLHHSADNTANSGIDIYGLRNIYPKNKPRYMNDLIRRLEIDG